MSFAKAYTAFFKKDLHVTPSLIFEHRALCSISSQIWAGCRDRYPHSVIIRYERTPFWAVIALLLRKSLKVRFYPYLVTIQLCRNLFRLLYVYLNEKLKAKSANIYEEAKAPHLWD